MQREWLPNEGPEKVYLADEPQRLIEPSERFFEKESSTLAAEKLKVVHRPQSQNIEMNLSPEHFYGIEGLSRSKRAALPLT